jgi:hypothetical protein
VQGAYGRFARSFALSGNADGSKVAAEFKDGLLEVHLPKSERAKAKSVEVKKRRDLIEGVAESIRARTPWATNTTPQERPRDTGRSRPAFQPPEIQGSADWAATLITASAAIRVLSILLSLARRKDVTVRWRRTRRVGGYRLSRPPIGAETGP